MPRASSSLTGSWLLPPGLPLGLWSQLALCLGHPLYPMLPDVLVHRGHAGDTHLLSTHTLAWSPSLLSSPKEGYPSRLLLTSSRTPQSPFHLLATESHDRHPVLQPWQGEVLFWLHCPPAWHTALARNRVSHLGLLDGPVGLHWPRRCCHSSPHLMGPQTGAGLYSMTFSPGVSGPIPSNLCLWVLECETSQGLLTVSGLCSVLRLRACLRLLSSSQLPWGLSHAHQSGPPPSSGLRPAAGTDLLDTLH